MNDAGPTFVAVPSQAGVGETFLMSRFMERR